MPRDLIKDMFDTLHPMTEVQVVIAAETLHSGAPVLTMVDPAGIFLLMTPCPNRECDFKAIYFKEDQTPASAPIPAERAPILQKWMEDAWTRVAKQWQTLPGDQVLVGLPTDAEA
jgi:hypothetical protein